jgi:hypothetical protein
VIKVPPPGSPVASTIDNWHITNAVEKERGEFKSAWLIGNGTLLIFCGIQAQQGKILEMEKLNGKKIKSHVPDDYSRLRGVITWVPIYMSTAHEISATLIGEDRLMVMAGAE